MRKNKQASLAGKISLMVLAIVVLCSAFIGVFSYALYRRDSIEAVAGRADAVAKTIAAAINAGEMREAAETNTHTPYWQEIKAIVDKTRAETSVEYLYVMSRVEGDSVVYLVDAYNPDDAEVIMDIGDIDDAENFADEMFETFRTGATTITGIYDSGDYGFMVSGFAPVLDGNGNVFAVVGVDVRVGDALQSSNIFAVEIVAIALGCSLLFGLITMRYIGRSVGRPLAALAEASGKISLGDTGVELSIRSNDEIGRLADSFRDIIDSTHRQTAALEALANRDLSAEISPRGENDVMAHSIRRLTETLNDMFRDIQGGTTQVSAGSIQIANGAQLLAQGSAEQAAAIERLSADIEAVAAKTRNNADLARDAAGLAGTIKNNAEKGSGQMSQMMRAVEEINEASRSIGKVIKVIDDIAFQTNILALNAAVEAARAGQHGKGFAVVADEVRNLASKSAVAAKDTGELISNSIQKAELGAGIARETSRSLDEIVSGIIESTRIVGEIAQSSVEQSEAIGEINNGIDRIAHVVQQNSATARQSATASEGMRGQSDMLNRLVSRFKLNKETAFRVL